MELTRKIKARPPYNKWRRPTNENLKTTNTIWSKTQKQTNKKL